MADDSLPQVSDPSPVAGAVAQAQPPGLFERLGSGVANLWSGLKAGTGESAEGIGEGFHGYLPSLTDWGARTAQANPEVPDSAAYKIGHAVGGFAGYIPGTVAEIAGGAMTGLSGGVLSEIGVPLALAGTGLNLAVANREGVGDAIMRQRQEAAAEGQPYVPSVTDNLKAEGAGLADAALFGAAGKLGKAVGSFMPEVTSRAGMIGTRALEGAATMGTLGGAQTFVDRAAGNQPVLSPDAFKEAAESAAAGAVFGGVMGAGHGMLEHLPVRPLVNPDAGPISKSLSTIQNPGQAHVEAAQQVGEPPLAQANMEAQAAQADQQAKASMAAQDAASGAQAQQAKLDAANAPRTLFEVAPDPNNKELTAQWNALDSDRKDTISNSIHQSLTPKVFDALGIKGDNMVQTYGGYKNDINPSLSSDLVDATREQRLAAASALGKVYNQDSTILIDPDSPNKVGAISIDFGKDVSHGDVQQLYDKLRAQFGDRIDGFTGRKDGIDILNFNKDEPTAKLALEVNDALKGDDNHYTVGYHETGADFIGRNDYDNNLRGQDGAKELLDSLGKQAQTQLGEYVGRPDIATRPELDAAAAATEGLSESGSVGRSSGASPSHDEAAQAVSPLVGLPTKVAGTPETYGPFEPAHAAADQYAADSGIQYQRPLQFAKVDTARAKRIADEYDKMQHAPDDPQVKAAYRAMIDETMAQWQAIKKTGLNAEFIKDDQEYPYVNPREAIDDVVKNNHLWVYPTERGFGTDESADVSKNPLLEPTGETVNGHPTVANDIFRIVHDYFGHVKEGVGFRADGKENAWRAHAAMYSPLARRAMTSETRGQNSWVNYGPHGDFNRTASGADTIYADQKTGLLPEWVSEEGSHDPVGTIAKAKGGVQVVRTSVGDRKLDDTSSDVPYLGSSRKNGDVVLQRGLDYTIPDGILKGLDTRPFLAEHEAVERTLENKKESYTDSHKQATDAEHALLLQKLGLKAGTPDADKAIEAYEAHNAKLLKQAAAVKDPQVSPDLVTKPYEHPHTQAQREMLGDVEQQPTNRAQVNADYHQSDDSLGKELAGSDMGRALAAVEASGRLKVIHDPDTQWAGQWDGKTATLNAAKIKPGEGIGVALHELGVHGMGLGDILGPRDLDMLSRNLDAMKTAGGADADLVSRAEARVPGSSNAALRKEERLAYFVEEAANEKSLSARAATVFRAVVARLKAAILQSPFGKMLQRAGVRLTSEDIVALARRAVEQSARSARDAAGRPLYSMPDTDRESGFYSALSRSIENGKGAPKAADATAWKQWLDGALRRGEFKLGERQWTGIDQWLDSKEGKITRDQLLDYARSHETKIIPVKHGENDDYGNAVKYKEYKTKGGENYREHLLTLPNNKDARDKMVGEYNALKRERDSMTDQGDIDKANAKLQDMMYRIATNDSQNPEFLSKHFNEKNILAHVRMTDRASSDGKPSTHIEEIQSDWHQNGRESGYKDDAYKEEYKEWGALRDKIIDGLKMSSVERARYRELSQKVANSLAVVPNAPMRNTEDWAMLGFKHALRDAVERGHDRVTWSTGDQQADRYDLSKHISTLRAAKLDDGNYVIKAADNNGVKVLDTRASEDELPSIVGKEIAEKIVGGGDHGVELSGLDMKVGGNGMRGFYDNILPKSVQKYVKQFGGKVGESTINGRDAGSIEPRQIGGFVARAAGESAVFSDKESAAKWIADRSSQKVHSVDITPTMRKAVEDGQPMFSMPDEKKSAKDDAKTLAEGVEAARENVRNVDRASWAQRDRAIGNAEATLGKFRDHFDAILKQNGGDYKAAYKSVIQFQNRNKIDDPTAAAFLSEMEKLMDKQADDIRAYGEDKLSLIDSYFPQIWKDAGRAPPQDTTAPTGGRRPLAGRTGFRKERVFGDYQEGFDAGRQPEYANPVDAIMARYQAGEKYLSALAIRDGIDKLGLLQKVGPDERMPRGYARVNDPAFNGHAVPEMVAKDLNNYLAPGLSQFSQWRGFRWMQNALLTARLGFSAFHAGFTTVDSAITALDVGMRYAAMGNIPKALSAMKELPLAPIRALGLLGRGIAGTAGEIAGSGKNFESDLMQKFYGRKAMDANTAAVLDAITMGGARAKYDPTDMNNDFNKVLRTFRQEGIKGLAKTPMANLGGVLEATMRPISSYLVPAQKMTARVMMMQQELDRAAQVFQKHGRTDVQQGDYANIVKAMNPAALREIAHDVVQRVDDRLGQVAYDNLFWNRSVKDILQATIQSVGWNVGTKNVIFGGLRDIGKIFKPDTLINSLDKEGKINNVVMHRITGRLSYLISLNVGIGVLGGMLNYAMTGQAPQELRDYFFPRTGDKNPDGTDARISFPSYVKDEFGFAKHPIDTIEHKLHPSFSMIAELINNKDFYGNQVYNPDDPWTKVAAQIAKHVGEGFEPYAVQNQNQVAKTGGGIGQRALPFFGLTPAPGDITHSPFQNYVRDTYYSMHSDGKTPEAAEQSQKWRDVVAQLRLGQQPDMSELSPPERKSAIKYAHTDPIAKTFSHLSLEQKFAAWDKATPQERAQYKLAPQIARTARTSLRTMQPDERRAALEKLHQIQGQGS